MPPSEFWAASLDEIMLLLDAWTPEKRYGNLTQSQVDSLEANRDEWSKRGFNLA